MAGAQLTQTRRQHLLSIRTRCAAFRRSAPPLTSRRRAPDLPNGQRHLCGLDEDENLHSLGKPEVGHRVLGDGEGTVWSLPSSRTLTTAIASPWVIAVTVPGSWLRVESFIGAPWQATDLLRVTLRGDRVNAAWRRDGWRV